MTTETAAPTEPAAPPPQRRAAVRRVVAPARPTWESAFRDPIRDGHVRLGGLPWAEGQAARLGLVTLTLLLVSLLLADRWRSGELLPIGDGESLRFLPEGLLAVTLVTFLVAWLMLCWGALVSGWVVTLVVAVGFLLVNATLAIVPTTGEDRLAYDHGPDVVRWCYFAVPALLLLSLGLRFLPGRVASIALGVLRGLVLLGLAAFFVTPWWIHLALVEDGFGGITQQAMAVSMQEINALIMPLLYVAAVLVVDFSLNVASGVARTVHATSQRYVPWLLAGLVLVKLWFVLGDELGEWATYAADQTGALVRTLVSCAALAVAVWLVGRRPPTDQVDRAKEVLLYGASVGLVLALLVGMLVTGAGLLVLVVDRGNHELPGIIRDYPAQTVTDWLQPASAVLAVVVGLWLLRRGRDSALRYELGSGMVVVGAWVLPSLLINIKGWDIGFSAELLDVVVTLAVGAVLLVRWRRLEPALAVSLAALTIFLWLAVTKGDWIALVGQLFGLSAVIVVVVGVVFSVLGDAGFTANDGRAVPRGARVLLFVGYLVLSVTILHWVETTHSLSQAGFQGESAFYFIGVPWATWVIARKLLHLEIDDADRQPL